MKEIICALMLIGCVASMTLTSSCDSYIGDAEAERLQDAYRHRRATQWHRRGSKPGMWLKVEGGYLYDDGILSSPVFVPGAR